MIRHILFWNYTDEVKAQHKEEEMLAFLKDSVNTMNGHIEGLICADIDKNMSEGYDLVFYSEFENEEALKAFSNHPLHIAHKNRCMNIVTGRLCGDIKA